MCHYGTTPDPNILLKSLRPIGVTATARLPSIRRNQPRDIQVLHNAGCACPQAQLAPKAGNGTPGCAQLHVSKDFLSMRRVHLQI
jgi:hypothetical protein